MVAPSIGQVMLSSTRVAASLAIAISGITHIVPMTWQKTKKSKSEMDCMLVREWRGLMSCEFSVQTLTCKIYCI